MKLLAGLSFTALLILGSVTGNAQECVVDCPSNIIVKADAGQEGALVFFPASTSFGDCGSIRFSKASGSFFRIGSHSVIVTSSSGKKCAFTITVTDNESPVLSEITVSTKKTWPSTNRMKKVAVYYTATDNAQDVTSVLSVYSNDTTLNNRDWEVVNNHLIRLKASRLANGESRIYTIRVTSTDEAGNRTSRTTSIVVSKNIGLAYAANDLVSRSQPED